MNSTAVLGTSLGMSRISAPVHAKLKNPNNIINVGMIGTGSRGNFLMDEIRKIGNVVITDMCDVYEPHMEHAWERNGKKGRKHTDYKRLLEQKEIDAVFVVTPLKYHVPQCLDALSAGKHVYCEKTLAYSVKEANEFWEKRIKSVEL